MKKIYTLILLLSILCSCSKDMNDIETPEGSDPSKQYNMIETTFTATIDQSRAYLDSKQVYWEIDDKVGVIDNVSGSVNTFTVVSKENDNAVLSGTIPEGSTQFAAVYPLTAAISADFTDRNIVFSVPADQTISKHTIDPNALVCVSFSEDSSFRFSNAISLLEFTMPLDDITSVTLRDINGTKFAGETTITISDEISSTCTGSSSITLTNESGFTKDETYYLALAPSTFAQGFQIIYSTATEKGILSSKKEFVFKRNSGKNIGSVSPTWIPSQTTGIMTLSQLKAFAVCADVYTTSDIVNLGADINAGGQNWLPIRTFNGTFNGNNHHIYNIICNSSKYHFGLFETTGGTMAVIKNLCVGSKDYDFNTNEGTYDGTSQFVLNSTDNTEWNYAGIIGYANNNTTIDNLVNFVPVSIPDSSSVRFRLGGIAGTSKASVTIKNCSNYGDITSADFEMTGEISRNVSIGGITGAINGANCKIENCYNYGTIYNTNSSVCHVGGITGVITQKGTISGSINEGKVENAGACIGTSFGYAIRTGGITGATMDGAAGSEIIDCTNNGKVYFSGDLLYTTKAYNAATGGICGCTTQSTNFRGCQNNGEVAIKKTNEQNCCLGGIIGYTTQSANTTIITDSESGRHTLNTADLIQNVNYGANIHIGGIAGCLSSSKDSLIENAENSGEISLTPSIQSAGITINMGGIAGSGNMSIKNCKNTARIYSTAKDNLHTSYFGGIIGGSTEFKSVSDCINEGKIQIGKGIAASRFGGICATLTGSSTIQNCTNKGEIYCTRSEVVNVGGITGYVVINKDSRTTLNNCTLNCTIQGTAKALGSNLGLVAGGLSVDKSSILSLGQININNCTLNKIKIDGTFVENIPLTSTTYKNYLIGTSSKESTNVKFITTFN